jgi:sterol desaturase/sphingolipid hydroxylase (fatty acid hydroxylase superfamily)
VADTVAACAAVVKASNRLVVDAALKTQAQTGADMERAARQALTGMRPAFEQRWRWQRWAALVGAFTAGCVAMGLVGATAWTLSAAVARQEAGAEVARWQAWWTATCADQSPHRVVVAGKPVCQVPIEQAARN